MKCWLRNHLGGCFMYIKVFGHIFLFYIRATFQFHISMYSILYFFSVQRVWWNSYSISPSGARFGESQIRYSQLSLRDLFCCGYVASFRLAAGVFI